MAEEEAVSLSSIAKFHSLPVKEFEKQYKNHISGFRKWDQIDHCEEWILFPDNVGEHLSIDETALSNGDLHTVITNKSAKGKKGALVAMVEGVKSTNVIDILTKLPIETRVSVKEVTLDMSNSMDAIIRKSLPNATIVTDRFHVQQLVSDAVQDIRITLRRATLKEENTKIKESRKHKIKYVPQIYENGDTKKQLLARSRGLLFKPASKWTKRQNSRSIILFEEFPELKKAYELSMLFRSFYEYSKSKEEAKESLNHWYKKIEEKNIDSFNIAAESIRLHETTILNYFPNRSTNASAESFNAKLKGFRSVIRGVRDKKFYLFRLAKLYG